MYTVKDFLHFVYPLVGQNGVTRLLGGDDLYFMVNQAVAEIYNFQPEKADHRFHWSWTHRKDVFKMSQNKPGMGVCFTRWPVRMIDEFWTSKWNDSYNLAEDKCYCDMNLPDTYIKACDCCDCCEQPCEPLELKQIRPQSNLCPGTYQIAGSFVDGMGGLDGRILRVNAKECIDMLWVTYYCGPLKVSKPDDQIPLPDSFMHIAAKIIAANVMPMNGESRQQDDLQYYSTVRRELECLVKQDPEFPKFVALKENPARAQRTVSPNDLSYNF